MMRGPSRRWPTRSGSTCSRPSDCMVPSRRPPPRISSRRTDHGMQWHDSETDQAFAQASRVLTEVFVDREVALIKAARTRPQPNGWVDSAVATQSVTWLTAEELSALGDQLMDILATHRDRIDDPTRRPPGSRPVRMIALAAPDDGLLAPNHPTTGGHHELAAPLLD
jgi:hypothetical protein